MTEEEIGLLHTLSKMPEKSWLEMEDLRDCALRLLDEGYIRNSVVPIPGRRANIIQLTEAGRFYVRSTPE